jgi:Mg2+-importing ATPase
VPLAQCELAACASLPPLLVLRRLESTPRGLAEREAHDRLARYGENTVSWARPPHWSVQLLVTVRNPFVLLLTCLDVVSAVTGDLDGAAVITAMVMISCLVRFRQEYRSDRAAGALRAMVATTATVLRRASAGSVPVARELPVDLLVPGDIVRLAAGDMVPADLRLLRSDELTVSQAVLTGESQPSVKYAAPDAVGDAWPGGDGDAAVFGCPWLCFMGTSVVSGSGTGVVAATGASAYFGATQSGLPRRPAETAFDRGVKGISWTLICFMLVCVPAVLAVTAVMHGHKFEAFLFAVSVAVGLTPEMLPAVVTTTLARGAGVMAGRGAIVKRLPAIHNLGAMDVLCTDKTGTLTEDQTSLDCYLDPSGRPDPDVLRWACVNSYWQAECSGAAIGDVLDEALLRRAAELDISVPDISGPDGLTGVSVIPFDFARRRVTVAAAQAGRPGRCTLVTKGAVESVLDCCARVRAEGAAIPLGPAERARLSQFADAHAADGVRLLAVAVAGRTARLGGYRPADEADLTLIGFVGFRDVPRDSAGTALAALAGHGVDVKVITGDHPLVAARICRDAGIEPGRVVLGTDLDDLSDAALAAVAATANVFARADPAQKARVVTALRSAGHTVGFLGDGVNDAPALRAADVGISVANAVDVARECAEVILLRKDLMTLDQAVAEGRRTFGNIVKYIKITVSSNFGNSLSMLAASALLPFLPMLPLQVLAQNLCFDLSQLALGFDRADEPSLRRPRTFDPRDLARFVVCFGPVNTLADLATFVILWRIMGPHGGAAGQVLLRTGWFTENLLTQALAVHLLRSRARPSARHHAAWPVLLTTAAVTLTALFLPFSPLAPELHMHALPLAYFPLLAAVLGGYCAATAAVKTRYLRTRAPWL